MSRAIENEPAARWPQLTILGFGMVLAMSPSFAAAAVAPILREEWTVGTLELPFLTVVVQLGFAVGALGLAVIGAPDVISGPKLFAAGALVAAAANLGFGLFANDPASAVAVPVPDRHGPGGRLSRRDEAGRRLVPSRPRTGDRRGQRRPDGRGRAALPLPGDRRVRGRGLAPGGHRGQRRRRGRGDPGRVGRAERTA